MADSTGQTCTLVQGKRSDLFLCQISVLLVVDEASPIEFKYSHTVVFLMLLPFCWGELAFISYSTSEATQAKPLKLCCPLLLVGVSGCHGECVHGYIPI